MAFFDSFQAVFADLKTTVFGVDALAAAQPSQPIRRDVGAAPRAHGSNRAAPGGPRTFPAQQRFESGKGMSAQEIERGNIRTAEMLRRMTEERLAKERQAKADKERALAQVQAHAQAQAQAQAQARQGDRSDSEDQRSLLADRRATLARLQRQYQDDKWRLENQSVDSGNTAQDQSRTFDYSLRLDHHEAPRVSRRPVGFSQTVAA